MAQRSRDAGPEQQRVLGGGDGARIHGHVCAHRGSRRGHGPFVAAVPGRLVGAAVVVGILTTRCSVKSSKEASDRPRRRRRSRAVLDNPLSLRGALAFGAPYQASCCCTRRRGAFWRRGKSPAAAALSGCRRRPDHLRGPRAGRALRAGRGGSGRHHHRVRQQQPVQVRRSPSPWAEDASAATSPSPLAPWRWQRRRDAARPARPVKQPLTRCPEQAVAHLFAIHVVPLELAGQQLLLAADAEDGMTGTRPAPTSNPQADPSSRGPPTNIRVAPIHRMATNPWTRPSTPPAACVRFRHAHQRRRKVSTR